MADDFSDLPADSTVELVLLVDDNPINLQILYKTLEGSGYRLLVANDGEKALDIARKMRPSLILLDIMMPGIDGYEVCATLKRDPRTRDIAIIFLSALEDSSAKVKGFAVGGVDYVSKPFQADEIIARVRNHIKIHRLERALAKRNNELEAENQQILNAVSEGIVSLDREGRVTMINPAASAMTGWPAADCLGEQLSQLGIFAGGDDHPVSEFETLPYRSYRLGQPGHSDMEFICRRDQSLVPVAISSTPRAEGGAVVVLRDISEWVKSEDALRFAREELETQRQNMAHMDRLSTTGEMAAGIAHEVNQPLTSVANYARVAKRLLQADDLAANREKLIEIMEKLDRQSVRASDVIQRLRSYVKKPDGGRMLVDPNEILREVIALAEVDSRVNDVAVHFHPQPDLPKINLDVVQVQQVVINLVRNAIDAMVESPDRNDGVVVATALVDNQLEVSVSDRGAGIDAQIEEQLFNPFFSTKNQGMGIGLSICQSIIQSHGGEIGFFRNPDLRGVTFYFRLPVR